MKKLSLFLDTNSLANRMSISASNFTQKKMCLLSTECCQNRSGILCSIAVRRSTFVSRSIRVRALVKDAYKIKVLCFWWGPIDMSCVVSHVRFEGKLCISALRNTGNSLQKLESKTDFSKNSQIS